MLLPPPARRDPAGPDAPGPDTAGLDGPAPAMAALRRRLGTEAGEGVISTGIVVLIMALIGAAMWVAFSGTAKDAADRVDQEVQEIGSDGG